MEIGVDIEDIGRFAKLDFKNDRAFFEKIFTEKEIEYCVSKANPCRHFAARFAGKEAVIKALQMKGVEYKDIEILNDLKGVPRVRVNLKNGGGKINKCLRISLSHCKDKAIAFVVLIR